MKIGRYLIIVIFSIMLLNSPSLGVSATTITSPLTINGNADLTAKASAYGWTGSGTNADPYTITGIHISNSNDYSFVIENTNLYFVFENNIISAGIVGVYLHNVKNGILKNNIISNTEKFGMLFDGAENNLIMNNTIKSTSNGMGLLVTNSLNNQFTNNTSEKNYSNGFFLSQNTTNNTFTDNYAISNGNANTGAGFYVVFTTGNSLIGNYAINNTIYGIFVENSAGTYLKDNTETGNGKILDGEGYSKIFLFLGIVVLLLVVSLVLALINKKYS